MLPCCVRVRVHVSLCLVSLVGMVVGWQSGLERSCWMAELAWVEGCESGFERSRQKGLCGRFSRKR